MKEDQLKKEYERRLAALRETQNNCDHEWDAVKYEPKFDR